MPLLPDTKILIAEYGNANFDYGELPDGDEDAEDAAMRVIRAKETLVSHLETHYTPTPKA